jgi:hypothetical protein
MAMTLAGWKRIDPLQENLPSQDQGRACREVVSIED